MHIKKFLHYSFITVAEIFLFFRKLRNYRRIGDAANLLI
ncbi:HTH-type transcriptional regulator gadX domain protein [Escherichia coli DEC11C]|nr:HTH-type transcriptional regulator gadX domain protein [Escherichia coli DEC11C]